MLANDSVVVPTISMSTSIVPPRASIAALYCPIFDGALLLAAASFKPVIICSLSAGIVESLLAKAFLVAALTGKPSRLSPPSSSGPFGVATKASTTGSFTDVTVDVSAEIDVSAAVDSLGVGVSGKGGKPAIQVSILPRATSPKVSFAKLTVSIA